MLVAPAALMTLYIYCSCTATTTLVVDNKAHHIIHNHPNPEGHSSHAHPRLLIIQIIDATYTRIKPIADADNALWQRGDPARGYQQLTTEFIPIRTMQLLSLYAPGGADALLPAAQGNGTAAPKVVLDAVVADGSLPLQQRYVRVVSQAGGDVAVDVSGWRLVGKGLGGSPDYVLVFPPGE